MADRFHLLDLTRGDTPERSSDLLFIDLESKKTRQNASWYFTVQRGQVA